MFSAQTEKALADVEKYLSNASSALVSGEPVALEAASTALRQAAIDFSNFLQAMPPSDRQDQDLKLRLKKIANGMSALKDGLFRRTALVDMALNAVVPATRDATYAKATGPYGSLGKQSGAFKYLAA